jgi:DNA-binding transcriptional regulator YiaG
VKTDLALIAIRDSRIVLFLQSAMSFQTRRKIVRRKRRSSASSMKSLSERLFDWRKRNDLSQSEAALKLRVSKRTLQEWEHGRAEPRHLARDAIAAVIGR